MNEWTVDVDRRIYKGIEVGMLRGFIKEGDPIVIVTGELVAMVTGKMDHSSDLNTLESRTVKH